jgi:tetratricopeptide (TPR) repeat protein
MLIKIPVKLFLLLALTCSCFCFSQTDEEHLSVIEKYFDNFNILRKKDRWEEIISLGTKALESAQEMGKKKEQAKICAQLTSVNFYQGNYLQALEFVSRCHLMSEEFEDPTLFIRALYLESAIYRAFAGKSTQDQERQQLYLQAVQAAEEAARSYSKSKLNNLKLLGKIYFNLGAAHADNPKGSLDQAEVSYLTAMQSFKSVNEIDDFVRADIRLAKVYVIQKKYEAAQEILNEIRNQVYTERIAMHADFLEAQLNLAINNNLKAIEIARKGLERAEALGAKEDYLRINSLISEVESSVLR